MMLFSFDLFTLCFVILPSTVRGGRTTSSGVDLSTTVSRMPESWEMFLEEKPTEDVDTSKCTGGFAATQKWAEDLGASTYKFCSGATFVYFDSSGKVVGAKKISKLPILNTAKQISIKKSGEVTKCPEDSKMWGVTFFGDAYQYGYIEGAFVYKMNEGDTDCNVYKLDLKDK